MTKAYKAVVEKGLSTRKAAELFGVPKSSLGDRVSGRVQLGAISVPRTYLIPAEENELNSFLIGCADIGYPRTRGQVIALVEGVLARKYGMEHFQISSGWWESFKKRHPELTFRTPQPLCQARALATSRETRINISTYWKAHSKRTTYLMYPLQYVIVMKPEYLWGTNLRRAFARKD